MADKYYARGQGKIYATPRDASGPTGGAVWLGDADVFQVTGSEENLVFRESYSGARAKVIDAVTATDLSVAMTLRDFSTENLTKAFYGSVTSGTGATIANEAHKAYPASSIFLKHPGVSAVTVTKLPSTTLVAGTDYTVDTVNGRIEFISTSTQITSAAGHDVEVDYTFATYSGAIEALAVAAPNYIIRFEGFDNFGVEMIATLWNVRLSVPSSLDLIGTEVGALQLTGGLQAAPEITVGSKFMKLVRG